MTSSTIHDQVYEYHSWNQLGEEIFKVAKQILVSGKKFDRVIALAKGGLTFSRSLNDFLEIKELSTFQIEFYTNIGTTNKTPVITQSLPVSIKDENVLIFDDVVDRGETLKLALDYIKYHGVKEMTTATLIYKPWSTIKPDFFSHETEAWVIFPNESRETIQLLKKNWQKLGDSEEQIVTQLLQIGFPKAEVELFMKIE
jgi:hypoxanthine phosphoribosyltransferase